MKLDKGAHKRILDRLEILKTNPFNASGIKQLQGKLRGKYRLRIGYYRAVYEVDKENNVVIILVIGPRGDIYK